MSRSKYATVAERDGDVSVFLGKKEPQFSFVKILDDDGGPSMERIEFQRRALLHLPEQMDSDAFREFTEGREISAVVSDCIGLGEGDE